jgi:hypothetical protein
VVKAFSNKKNIFILPALLFQDYASLAHEGALFHKYKKFAAIRFPGFKKS